MSVQGKYTNVCHIIFYHIIYTKVISTSTSTCTGTTSTVVNPFKLRNGHLESACFLNSLSLCPNSWQKGLAIPRFTGISTIVSQLLLINKYFLVAETMSFNCSMHSSYLRIVYHKYL